MVLLSGMGLYPQPPSLFRWSVSFIALWVWWTTPTFCKLEEKGILWFTVHLVWEGMAAGTEAALAVRKPGDHISSAHRKHRENRKRGPGGETGSSQRMAKASTET